MRMIDPRRVRRDAPFLFQEVKSFHGTFIGFHFKIDIEVIV